MVTADARGAGAAGMVDTVRGVSLRKPFSMAQPGHATSIHLAQVLPQASCMQLYEKLSV